MQNGNQVLISLKNNSNIKVETKSYKTDVALNDIQTFEVTKAKSLRENVVRALTLFQGNNKSNHDEPFKHFKHHIK